MSIPRTNSKKCAFCGTGSQTFWLGMIIGLAEEVKAPIAIIERVNCKYATKDELQKEKQAIEDTEASGMKSPDNLRFEAYQVLGDCVYHCIKVSSTACKSIRNTGCTSGMYWIFLT